MRKRVKKAFMGLVLVVLTSSLGACYWGRPTCGFPGEGGPGGLDPAGLR